MSLSHTHSDKRNQARHSLTLRVDAKLLDERQKADILDGHGYPDLDQESLSLTKPRRGRQICQSADVSPTGLRLLTQELENLEKGATVELDVHLPGERRVVKVLAEVVWADGDEKRLAGLRFAALEDEGLRRLREYLGKLRD